jgi:hypothetical protein
LLSVKVALQRVRDIEGERKGKGRKRDSKFEQIVTIEFGRLNRVFLVLFSDKTAVAARTVETR